MGSSFKYLYFCKKEYDDLIGEKLEKDAQKAASFKDAFSNKAFLRALFVGCGLQFFQQLSAINTVMYYSASIFEMSGIRDPAMAIWMSAITLKLSRYPDLRTNYI